MWKAAKKWLTRNDTLTIIDNALRSNWRVRVHKGDRVRPFPHISVSHLYHPCRFRIEQPFWMEELETDFRDTVIGLLSYGDISSHDIDDIINILRKTIEDLLKNET